MAVWSSLKISSLSSGKRLDPEYYQPRYIADAERLRGSKCETLGNIAFVTDGIHGSPDEVEEGGIRYLSAKCVKDNDFSLGDTLWISQSQHDANPRTSLKADDLLITTVGTIGNAAVVQPDILPANSDRHLGIVRLNDVAPVDSYFIAAFLNSEYGRFQSLREATGNVQLNLFIEKIKELKIPILRCAGKASKKTKQAYEKRMESAARVKDAEKLMLSCLGLGNLDLSSSKTYIQDMSKMKLANRFGAEFFMPSKQRVLEKLGSSAHEPLSNYVKNVRDLWNPETSAPTEQVRNFDLGHALEPFLDNRQVPVAASEIGSAKKKLLAGDVVISRLRSYLKQISVVQCGGPIPCVGSSEFIVLRPIGDLAAETLLAFLRCELVQVVLKWSQDGTNHPRFDEKELLSIPIPIRVLKSQEKMQDLVNAAIGARQDMLRLIEEAKELIVSEINENGKSRP